MQNISDMSRRLSIVYVWSLLVLSFMESSILATFYIFSFFLVFKLCKSSLQILFGPSHIFGQCWYWWLFNSGIIWKVNFNSCSFFRCFFLTCKLYMSGRYIISYFGHGQCSIWGFLVLTFIKRAKLTTIYSFWWFFTI